MANISDVSSRERAVLELLREAGVQVDGTIPAADVAALADVIDAVASSDVNVESGGLEALLPGGLHLNVKKLVWNALAAGLSAIATVVPPHVISWPVAGYQFIQSANKVKESFTRLSPGQENLYATVAEITARKRRTGISTDGAYADEVVMLMNERERPADPYLAENITPFLDELASKDKEVFVREIDAAQRSFYRPVF